MQCIYISPLKIQRMWIRYHFNNSKEEILTSSLRRRRSCDTLPLRLACWGSLLCFTWWTWISFLEILCRLYSILKRMGFRLILTLVLALNIGLLLFEWIFAAGWLFGIEGDQKVRTVFENKTFLNEVPMPLEDTMLHPVPGTARTICYIYTWKEDGIGMRYRLERIGHAIMLLLQIIRFVKTIVSYRSPPQWRKCIYSRNIKVPWFL